MKHLLALTLSKKQFAENSEVRSRTAEDVYRAHVQDVARWAARLGGPNCDVEDVVQEVFLIVQQSLAGFKGESKLETWLYRITQNTIRYRRRKEAWRRWLGGSAEETAGELPSPERDANALLEQAEANRRVYRVLDGMSEKYRTVLILFEMEELSGEEIAELTGTKLATVWVHLHRARADFLRRLEAVEAEG